MLIIRAVSGRGKGAETRKVDMQDFNFMYYFTFLERDKHDKPFVNFV